VLDHELRAELAPSYDPNTASAARLLSFFTISDIHIADKESPAQPLYIGWSSAFGSQMSSAYSPVILSSTPIPGNEDAVYRVVNNLFRQGANVVYSEQNPGIHVSGHGSREELSMMVNLTRPKYIVPVHGEYRHVVTMGRLAAEMGFNPDEILTPEVGDIIEFTDEGAAVVGRVPSSGSVMVDGIGVGDVSEVVLRDRRHLADEGVVIVSLALDRSSGEILSGPDIVSRGFVLESESEDLYERARDIVLRELASIEPDYTGEWSVVKTDLRRALNKFFRSETRRHPMVLPVIVEV
jgi:ribonuclease J